MRGFRAVLRKETLHMRRDKGLLPVALVLPVFQLMLFGLIDTNVHRVPTVVVDHSRTERSRALLRSFVSTSYFEIVADAPSSAALREAIVAGRAQVGIEIPPDFARRRQRGLPTNVLVLIDGSDNTIASQALGAANGVGLARSLDDLLARAGVGQLPVDVRPVLLFNPDARSANLLLPGLIAILLTFSGTLLASYAIVRERERGTLEQLMVTPVSPPALMLGKLLPYVGLAFAQMLVVLGVMTTVFRVPIHGSLVLLLALSLIYLFSLLSLGLLVSSVAQTQMQATQLAQLFLLPSIMLSGYIFPLSSLPAPLRVLAQVLPATHFIAIARGIIIRGAGFLHLWPHVLWLLGIAAVLVALSARAFRKTLA